MKDHHLAGLIFYSPSPEQLAGFYRERFGIPFEPRRHGKTGEHLECDFGGIHFAVLKATPRHTGGRVVPSFVVNNLEKFLEGLDQEGIRPLHQTIDIGEGKRVSSVSDVDGNMIRLLEVG